NVNGPIVLTTPLQCPHRLARTRTRWRCAEFTDCAGSVSWKSCSNCPTSLVSPPFVRFNSLHQRPHLSLSGGCAMAPCAASSTRESDFDRRRVLLVARGTDRTALRHVLGERLPTWQVVESDAADQPRFALQMG